MPDDHSLIIIDIKRIIRELEDLRHKLELMDRKIDDITNHLTTQQLNKRVIT